MNAAQDMKQETSSSTPSESGPHRIRVMLARLLSLLIPGTEHCRQLSSEEEIIACMAKRHPTLFIT